ncbi:MAG: sigma 54-interacting transcriptional regulator [Candidatus Aminicenantes bacterium]|nr:MAG: sigma 54-interacting transcriptional regulator [Candidatus Aminicenantes bacterium]
MFESVKTQLWDILKKKQVSLVMIFDKNGDILWHKGRKIEGKSIYLGTGFSKSFARKIITKGDMIKKENVEIVVFGNQLSESAVSLNVKSLIILPVKTHFFLYLDSGTKETFTETDMEVFKVMGELLEKMIETVMEDEEDSEGITGASPEIKKIREMVLKYSLEEELVLLIGETGVGKSHIAELIHRYSGRKGKFVVAEITSISENLKNGKSFWEVVKEPFLNRDLNRQQVKAILSEALTQTDGNYKDTLRLFNLDEEEYGTFMKFLYRNHLK